MYNRQQSNRNWSQQLPVSIIMLLGAIQIRCHEDTDEKPTKIWLLMKSQQKFDWHHFLPF